jgi:phenylalanyl-tRNA synthetase beta chain
MGGLFSEVTQRTRNVLLESAYFAPLSVRKTSRRLVLESAASYRFERGVDPELVLPASMRAAQMILGLAGGQLAPEPVDINCQKTEYGQATVRFRRIPKLIGYEVAPERVVEILSGLGLPVKERDGESVTVAIPPRRSDLSREADLIEEVLRHEGIEKVPFIEIATSELRPERRQKFLLDVREHMRGFGYYELLTDSFVTDSEGMMSFFGESEPVRVRNPVNAGKPALRQSLLPNMLVTYRTAQAAGESIAGMFEASVIYLPGQEKLPDEKHVLAFLSLEGYLHAKGTLEALLQSLRVEEVAFESASHAAFAPAQAAAGVLGGKRFALLGCLSRETAQHFGIEQDCAVCELDIDYLYSCLKDKMTFTPIPRFPKVLRDMAVVIGEQVLWQELREEILCMEIPLLVRIKMFDMYHGKQLPAGKKSIAFSLEFQSPERTLTGEEVDRHVMEIASHLAVEFGARLRK